MVLFFYSNNGFTDDNIPDSPSLLGNPTFTQNDAELVQIYGLTSIRAYMNENLALAMNYLAIMGNATTPGGISDPATPKVFYKIRGYRMLDPGTAEFFIEIDAYLTVRAIHAGHAGSGLGFTILDGIIERAHIAKANDTLTSCPVEDDPLLTCARPLEIEQTGTLAPNSLSSIDYTIIESTLNIAQIGENAINSVNGDVYIYEDTVTGEKITVPTPIRITDSERTAVYMGTSMTNPIYTPGTAYFDASNNYVQKGLEIVLGLGLESAIVGSVVLPTGFNWTVSKTSNGRISLIKGYVGSIYDISLAPTGFRYAYANVNNKRVLLGEFNKYTIQSIATGEKTEFLPEELIHSNDVAPEPYCYTDPRTNGKPYYRFRWFRGTDASYSGQIDSRMSFFRGAVKGLPWQNAPQIYYNKSGNIIDNLNYQIDKDISNYEFTAERSTLGNSIKDVMNRFKGSAMSFTNSHWSAPGREGMLNNPEFWGYNMDYLKHGEQNLKRDKDFALSQKVVAPTITFPVNESLRDWNGNGCIAYRVHPSSFDIARQDKLLSMYGYKQTKALELSDFTNRSKFNYVQAQNVSVQIVDNYIGNMQVANALAEQLSNGVRIWHTTPDINAYTDGSNV